MTKEQIAKHKEVMLWFITNPDKGVWRKPTRAGRWDLIPSPEFHLDYTYVQNDDYSHLRKAQVEGKTIQLFNAGYTTELEKDIWHDEDTLHTHIPVPHYRVKPEEPKWHVGDWVRSNITGRSSVITLIRGGATPILTNEVHGRDTSYTPSDITPWKPEIDEWCVFYDTRVVTSYTVGILKSIRVTPTDPSKQFLVRYGQYHRNCAPLEFLQTLKD